MPYLSRIAIYPIKSLGPAYVHQVRIVENGALEHDREFALFDGDGKFVNAKRTPRFHYLSTSIDWKDGLVTLHNRETKAIVSFHIHQQRTELEEWLSGFFGLNVFLKQDSGGGFPDDKKASGPTFIGTSTLDEVSTWYPGSDKQEMAIRFRANLEISDAPAFWEDRLYREADAVVPFRVGSVLFHGANPCQRCIVPTRDMETGEPKTEFSQIFRAQREANLPAWAEKSRFNHFYRLAVNTNVPESEIGKLIRVGDRIELC
jgi:uncharacterized protein YcbX